MNQWLSKCNQTHMVAFWHTGFALFISFNLQNCYQKVFKTLFENQPDVLLSEYDNTPL